MDVIQAINARRTIRSYKDMPLPQEVLAAVLDAAHQAPSWANTQTWRFIVVEDRETRAKLSSMFPGNRGAGAILQAPVVIVGCSEMGRAGWLRGEKVSGKDWHLFDLGSALENLVLAATSFGLATLHVGNFDQSKLAHLLRVPEGYEVEIMLCLGYPAGEPGPKSRRELSEVVFAERFGEPYFK